MNTKSNGRTFGVVAFLAFLVVVSIGGVKVSRMTRTTTFQSNSLFIVVTGTTTKATRHIQAHDLARGLGQWITNSGAGGGAGDVTQAQLTTASNSLVAFLQPGSPILTDITAVASDGFLVVSDVGTGDATTRTLTESGNAITIANPTGSAGDPLFSLHAILENAAGTGITTNGTAISNAAVTFGMTVSNALAALELTRNAAVSNALALLLVANDTSSSNAALAQLNSASNAVTAYTLRPTDNTFWDEFDGRSIAGNQDIGTSPSGHYWHRNTADAANVLTLSNGFLRPHSANNSQTPVYYAFSNTVAGTEITRFGGTIKSLFQAGLFNNDGNLASMLLSDQWPVFGDDPNGLHVIFFYNRILFQTWPGQVNIHEAVYPADQLFWTEPWPFEVQWVSNTVWWSVGQHEGSFTHPDWFRHVNKDYLIYRAEVCTTNHFLSMRGSVWAGYASPLAAPLLPPSPTLLRGTNHWFDGGLSSFYTNTFVANIGGVTNILDTNLVVGSITRLEFSIEPGVTVGFPGTSAAQWGGVFPFFSTNAGVWNIVEVSVPSAGVTNYRHSVEGEFTLATGYKTRADSNYVTRTITLGSNERYTNYPTGALTVNCATDVTANITNAVASNYAITLATPVIGTSGSLGLVSDGSARTLAILSPVAITWLSTNDTATATNILTTASKRSLFAWSVRMGTDGISTNVNCWVKNQTP